MREIKFRAWDRQISGWTSNVLVDLVHINHPSYIEVQQYTGLKDKNGFEIYEGDIVKNPDGIAPVIYLSDGFVLSGLYKGETMDTQPLLWHPMSELEVIGNIYENPELLK